MVCEVCSVDRSDESGELVILDYPRYLAAECPCPNCGSGAPRVDSDVLRDLARQPIARQSARSAALRAFIMEA